jgi:4-amino-4-deoxy-L-arabinose transferase-like glycosyltransferase
MRDSYWRDPLLWLLVILAFVVRIAYNLALHPDGHPPKTFVIDETEYFGAAHVLAEGRGFSFFDKALWVRPPLYVASLAAVMSLAGDAYMPTLIFQALVSALTLPALAYLAFRVGGRKAARWTLILSLIYLPLTLFAGLLLSETLFVFLFAWSLVALTVARERLDGSSHWMAWLALAGAGVLLGLGVLTRSTALGFVPLAMLWLAWDRAMPSRRRFVAASVLLGVCLLTLAPWIARNYLAYGRFIPVDTTGGYNLWLASVGVRDEPRLQADLLAIPNPADRQSYAYARAFDSIAADPLKFVGKGMKESFDLWLPSFGAEERQVRGYALGRVLDWHLLALFLFDDLLYIIILLLAVIGLAVAPPHPLKSLTALWVLLWVVTSFVFFAVTRFRLPIVACLIPWAGVGIALLPELRSRFAELPRRILVAGAVSALAILLVIVPAVPLTDTWLGIERWGRQAPYRSAEDHLRQGDPDAAIQQYNRANLDLSDTRYGLASALLQVERPGDALALLRPDEDPDRFEPHIIRGEAARKAGNLDDARSFFNARAVQVAGEDALDWAWDHLRPPEVEKVELGTGLDVGYIRGFSQPERDSEGRYFRWTGEYSTIRRMSVGRPMFSLNYLVNAWQGGSASPATGVTFLIPVYETTWDRPVQFDNKDRWQEYTWPLPSYAGEVSLAVEGFVGGGDDPRLLGIRISSVTSLK